MVMVACRESTLSLSLPITFCDLYVLETKTETEKITEISEKLYAFDIFQ